MCRTLVHAEIDPVDSVCISLSENVHIAVPAALHTVGRAYVLHVLLCSLHTGHVPGKESIGGLEDGALPSP